MPAPRPPDFDTLSLHAGQHPDPATGLFNLALARKRL
jgi:hypothetical protein